jgi:hypothetical protein
MSTPAIRGLGGTGLKALQIPNKSNEQMDIFRQLGSGSSGDISSILQQLRGLAGGGDEETWGKLEAPALRQFGQLQGQIASRFSAGGGGPGAMSSRRGSGFNNAQGGAAADFAERLQGQRLGLQQGAQDRLMQLYQQLLGQDVFSTGLVPKQKPWWQELASSLGGGLSSAGGTLGGLYGAKAAGLFGNNSNQQVT